MAAIEKMFLRDRTKADSVLDTLLDPNQLDMGEIGQCLRLRIV
jgi:hypothetical protein